LSVGIEFGDDGFKLNDRILRELVRFIKEYDIRKLDLIDEEICECSLILRVNGHSYIVEVLAGGENLLAPVSSSKVNVMATGSGSEMPVLSMSR